MNKVYEKLNYWIAPYVWKKQTLGNGQYMIFKSHKPFESHDPIIREEKVKKSFIKDNKKWDHTESIRQCEGTFWVDPRSGFLLDMNGRIIRDSIVFDHYGIYPQKKDFLTKKSVTKIDSGILFDHFWGSNYFHFYSDVASKLFLIRDKMPALAENTLIISTKIYNSAPFQFFLKTEFFSSFNWHIQDPDEFILITNPILIRPMPYHKDYFLETRKLAENYLAPFQHFKRVFINRSEKTGRFIKNFSEIEPILERLNFEIVELEGKTLPEQIELFSSAGVIAGIHGAGLVNLIFSDPRVRVLEIMPDQRINSQYYWLSHELELSFYECLLGTELKAPRFFHPKGYFELNPQKTQQYLLWATGHEPDFSEL